MEATLPHLVLQIDKNDSEKRSKGDGVKESNKGLIHGQIAESGRITPRCRHRRLIADGSARIAS